MNIEDLTIGQAKKLVNMIHGFSPNTDTHHPKFDGKVVAQFIGRFVFVCNLEIRNGYCYLTNVKNIRYWESRENGLGGLALHGPLGGDKIDEWPDQIIPLDKLGPVMKTSSEFWS